MAKQYEYTGETIIRRTEVLRRTGMARSTLYARIKDGIFPAPVSLGGKSVGWIASEVEKWITGRGDGPRRLGPPPQSK